MKNSENSKTPMLKNGKKVNDWETLRPYVEAAKPPENVYIDNIDNGCAAFVDYEDSEE